MNVGLFVWLKNKLNTLSAAVDNMPQEILVQCTEPIRKDATKPLCVEVRRNDPTNPEIGRIWLRSDL